MDSVGGGMGRCHRFLLRVKTRSNKRILTDCVQYVQGLPLIQILLEHY